jgi:hypothetical protein
VIFCYAGQAQAKKDKVILESYSEYFAEPREYIHVHLNKTTLIEGEQLGFSAYVLDPYKNASLTATNLYCTITDSSNAIIKSKLLMVQKGVASNVFEIDSLLPPGNYRFNAYTNWIRNFNEKLYFSEPIQVLGPNSDEALNPKNEEAQLDIQVFPEGGYLLQNIENVLGILVKNQFGKGVGIKSGVIVNQLNDTIFNFKLDKAGIGRAKLRPVADEQYFVNIEFGNKTHQIPIKDIQLQGMLLNVSRMFGQAVVKVATNLNTLPNIKDKTYFLGLHNTKTIKTWEFKFDKGPRMEHIVEQKDLFPGMNIFTVFDEHHQPILERLFFNYNELPILESGNPMFQLKGDSLNVDIKIPKADPVLVNNLSVSILPKATKSYNTESNFLSNMFLRPYIKGYVQDAAYYFEDISNETLFNLDNLLITQGWSAYDWATIFGPKPATLYPYEQGISFKANINKGTSNNSYLIHPLQFTKSFMFDLEPSDDFFEATPLYPIMGEKLKISGISKSGKFVKSKIVPQFSPNQIPALALPKYTAERFNRKAQLNAVPSNEFNLQNVQELETVELTAVVQKTRYEKLKKLTRGTLDVFDDIKRDAYTDFATYISSKGFIVRQSVDRYEPGRNGPAPLLEIFNTTRTSTTGPVLQSPLIILDGIILTDLSVLYNFRMDIVDYIEIDKSGATMGMRGANGVIRIVTDPSVKLKQETFKDVQNIEFPLTFNKNKKYYVPKYPFYDTPFFYNYGVIDWFPSLKLDRTGGIQFSFDTLKNKEFVLFIEGVVNGNRLISEVKRIALN